MILADAVIVWIVGALLIGLLGFFVLLLVAVLRVFRFVLRLVLGPWRRASTLRPPGAAGRCPVCQHSRCGHLNRADARYCGRCGRPLSLSVSVDRHG